MMKKTSIILCSTMSFLCTSEGFAETATQKSGFYITGKVGASVLQQKNQKYLDRYRYPNYSYGEAGFSFDGWSDYEDFYGKSGGTHSNARLGGGIAIGYDFDTYFHVPVRTEIDVMARMGDSNNYLRDKYSYIFSDNSNQRYSREDKVNNKVQLNTFMFNAFYDFKNKSAFTPYVMAGVGLASMNHTTIRNLTNSLADATTNQVFANGWARLKRDHTTNNFAWNTGVGVRYKINTDFSLDFSYRYLGAGKTSFETWRQVNGYERSKTRVVTQDIMLGLTYNF